MLTRFHKILIAALAVQLILAVIVLTRGDDSAALKEHPILPGFDAAKVTRLQVFANDTGKAEAGKPEGKSDAKPIDLVKRDANWVMASGFDYPVEQTKLTDVLSPIAKLAAAEPIATQASRHKQLHVADNDFERKLVITADGKDVTLFIGSSVGMRRTAVRIGGDDRVYAVLGVTATTAGSEPRQWIDTAYVKVPRDEVGRLIVQRDGKKVEMSKPTAPAPAGAGSGSGSGAGSGSGSAALTVPPPSPPAAEHWSAAVDEAPVTPAAGESIDESTIDRLVAMASTMDLTAPADPKRDASKPTATITIERKAAGTATPAPTVIDVIADGTSYWVHDRSLPRAGLVDKARIEELIAVDREKLVKKPPPPPPPAPKGGPGAAAMPGLPPGMAPPAGHPPVTPPGH
jgi:hypothetical protein